jgi:hypothetical protein
MEVDMPKATLQSVQFYHRLNSNVLNKEPCTHFRNGLPQIRHLTLNKLCVLNPPWVEVAEIDVGLPQVSMNANGVCKSACP